LICDELLNDKGCVLWNIMLEKLICRTWLGDMVGDGYEWKIVEFVTGESVEHRGGA
jgi:hypothetical protein